MYDYCSGIVSAGDDVGHVIRYKLLIKAPSESYTFFKFTQFLFLQMLLKLHSRMISKAPLRLSHATHPFFLSKCMGTQVGWLHPEFPTVHDNSS
jgi:hypothetical protein